MTRYISSYCQTEWNSTIGSLLTTLNSFFVCVFQLFREVRIMKILNHPNIGKWTHKILFMSHAGDGELNLTSIQETRSTHSEIVLAFCESHFHS